MPKQVSSLSALPSASSTVKLHLSADEAAGLLYSEALEAHPPVDWNATKSAAASRDAYAVAGDSATDKLLLTTRSKLVLSRMRESVPSLRVPQTPEIPAKTLFQVVALGLVLLGFISGALTDRLASDGATLSLLSSPCLLVLAWNILAALLALVALCRRGSTAGALTTSIARSLIKVTSTLRPTRYLPASLQKSETAAHVEWFTEWCAVRVPQLAWFIRSALHLAALAFGVGLVVSLLVRGLGTAYVATWESTWFASRPDLVANLVSALYGLVPDIFPGVLPLPDPTAIAAMEAPASTAGAPWLARLIWLITLVIILPRALLTVAAILRARYETNHLTVFFPEERLTAIREEAQNIPKRTWLIRGADDLPQPVVSDFGNPFDNIVTVDPWSAPDFPALAQCAISARDAITLSLDPAATPEVEVHGELIRALLSKSPSLKLSLDFSRLAQRQALERLRSRQALWEHFAADAGIPVKVSGMPSEAPKEVTHNA